MKLEVIGLCGGDEKTLTLKKMLVCHKALIVSLY